MTTLANEVTLKTHEELAQDGRALLRQVFELLEVSVDIVIAFQPDHERIVFELLMSPHHLMIVTGEDGRTWAALRSILNAIGAQHHICLELSIIDPEPSRLAFFSHEPDWGVPVRVQRPVRPTLMLSCA